MRVCSLLGSCRTARPRQLSDISFWGISLGTHRYGRQGHCQRKRAREGYRSQRVAGLEYGLAGGPASAPGAASGL
jgi:hypothetical protein